MLKISFAPALCFTAPSAHFIFCFLFPFTLFSQPLATPAEARFQSFEQRKTIEKNSLLNSVKPESVGPSIFSCRVTDLDVNPADPSKMYVAYASGGLWYTESNGTSFRPVFDHEAAMTIGDVAVDWKNNIIWVGTGEANSSRSSYAGAGMYRSADGGKTWEQRGLLESHHIARVVLHPTDPNTLWVAVLGHLYTPHAERGVFKTTDGGKTWIKTLYVNDVSGAIDLLPDPVNPNTLYAATWERTRSAWNFEGAGAGSGIWKSIDGGVSWFLLNTSTSGFPNGPRTGRIGLAAGRGKDGKTVLYASIDNQNLKPKKDKPKEDLLTKDQLRAMTAADFGKIPEEKLSEFLKQNGFPEKYNAQKVKGLIAKNSITPLTLVEYLEDANNNLFETDYIGAEVYRSDDGGLSWKRTHTDPLDGMFFTYGYYFSNLRCAADNPDQLYLLGFLVIRSDDGGKNWTSINGDNVHPDHHALWVDPARPGHLVNGNDGGLNISWDNGDSWMLCNNPPVGQFYAIAVDQAEPYNIYGGAQDNGVWVGPNNYRPSTDWHQNGQYAYKSIMGGDGMQVQVDTRDNNTVYTGFQFGNYFRINKTTGQTKSITPKHELGERPLRFNWQTPIWLSRHNQDILYFGANRLYRSLDKGEHWEAISGDLTLGGAKGNVPYGTLTSIHESPLKFGLLYTGSDDGLVHVSRDGGESWTKISDNLPQKLWVSRVVASAHERGRVYVSLNGYRWDDFSSYLYTSEDYGKTWQRIGLDASGSGSGLPAEPVNVVREDPSNPDVLYVGTDHGVYVSLDRGKSFQTLSADFPDCPVHDLVVQADAKDLIIGTHGRSAYKVSVDHIQQLTPGVLAEALHLFDLGKKRFSKNWGKKQNFQALKGPELPVTFYAGSVGKVAWSVKMKESGLVLNTGTADCVKGLNRVDYTLDLREDVLKKYRETLEGAAEGAKPGKDKPKETARKPLEIEQADTGKYYLRKGVYTFTLEKDGVAASKDFTIE